MHVKMYAPYNTESRIFEHNRAKEPRLKQHCRNQVDGFGVEFKPKKQQESAG